MAKLLWVKGPHTTDPDRAVRVQWSMGNTCNFNCEYCPPKLHNGSIPWLSTDVYLQAIHKISQHYINKMNRRLHWELIGGEVTTIPGIEEIIKTCSEYNSDVTIYSNGSRTVEWWEDAKEFLEGVVLTYHPLSMDKQHFLDVVRVLKSYCTLDINIAGIGGQVEELGNFVNELRDIFVDNNKQSPYEVSICAKTMYNKHLGENNFGQGTYFDYTQNEMKVLQRPGLLPMPKELIDEQHDPDMEHPRFWSTEFMYDDAPAKYVQSHQIINEGLNQFKGMKCELGYDSINIDMHGEVISCWCGAKNFGNITQLDNWDFPAEPYVCPFDFCNNLSDISITKFA